MRIAEPRNKKPRKPPAPVRTPRPATNRRVRNQPIPRPPVERDEQEQQWPATDTALRAFDTLQPYESNPRVHDGAQIERLVTSIKRWGFTMPLLIDEHGVVIAGHARLEAAKRLQLKRVPVVVARGWNDEQRRAYVIADNQLALLSSWDRDVLAREMQLINDDELLRSVGFTDADMRALCDPDDLNAGPPADGSGSALAQRFLLLLEFDDETTFQQCLDEMQTRGVRVKVMS